VAVLCADDANVREIMPLVPKQIVTYGLERSANVYAENVVADGRPDALRLRSRQWQHQRLPITLNLPGRHNVLNALAAIAVATNSALPTPRSSRRWPSSRASVAASSATARVCRCRRRQLHAGRRLRPSPGRDGATLAAARGAFPGRRLLLAFQPHRYTRTRDCFEDFVKVLSGVDALVLAEVYAAGEQPIVAADGRALARALRVAGKVEPVFVEAVATCRKRFWMPPAMATW
jgi:UDP-N-acetylmuramate--alanine ligase